jgi:Asp-tRNA(Asn)/Glu-tRNA(Gln) amidotransferase A subunit family amidase
MNLPKQLSIDPSRRQLLQAAGSAALLSMGAGAFPLLHGCSGRIFQTPAQEDLLRLDARAVVERIRKGELRAEIYLSRLIAQCKSHAKLNAVAALDESRVLEAARSVDSARLRGEKLGLAAGLPFTVKDQISVVNYAATSGNEGLRHYRPLRNAVVVDALVKNGGIAFAKNTCADMLYFDGFMAQGSSYSKLFGTVHNPYDPTRIAGGSSGGSAAAVAACLAPAALALDTNGSVRIPAALCGVAGLRPSTYTSENAVNGTTRKRYSDAGVVLPGLLDTIGPIARTVTDVAFLDTLITGEPTRHANAHAVRIAIPRSDYWEHEWIDKGVATVVQAALARLRDAGSQLIEFDYDALKARFGEILAPSVVSRSIASLDARRGPEDYARWLQENFPGATIEQIYSGRPRPTASTGRGREEPSIEQRREMINAALRAYQDVFRSHVIDAIAVPTVPVTAIALNPDDPTGLWTIEVNGKAMSVGNVLARGTFLAPRVGAPSLTLPVGVSQGLPVGLQLDALPGNDSKLLGIGMAVEQVIGPIPPPEP